MNANMDPNAANEILLAMNSGLNLWSAGISGG
jgi:hypothetical protein